MKKNELIKPRYRVEKHNALNEIQSNQMSLEELRFFCIYLSKINARDPDTRVVRFSVDEFQKILHLGKANYQHLRDAAHRLLKKIIVIPKHKTGWKIEDNISIFTKCEVAFNELTGNGYVEINANDAVMPLLFLFKSHYFSYDVWNAMRLKSANQLRMYEILKQYERLGERIIPLDELRWMLGIQENEYTRYNNFRSAVLEVCRKALFQYTDSDILPPPKRRGLLALYA